MDSFWDFIWWTIVIFFFFAYLMVLWSILSDLFSDHTTSGWVKAIWIFALIFLPLVTALIYLIFRGKGMQERRIAAIKEMKAAQDSYIQQVAGTASPAEQISHAKELLEAGTITQAEFDQLKAKALS